MSRPAIDLDTIPATGATEGVSLECVFCNRQSPTLLVDFRSGLCRWCRGQR